MAVKYYAVRKGRKVGIFNTWDECKEQVFGFKGAEYKKFESKEEAELFMVGENIKRDIMESEEDINSLLDNEMIAYVDGSFNVDTHSYSYGVVLIDKCGIEEVNGIGEDDSIKEMRNVSGELNGAIVAMQRALEYKKDTLYLHYDYAGIEKWALGEWKRNKDGTKRYKEFYDSIKDRLKVYFVKVPAHEGIKYNEQADRLAKEAFKIKE